LIDEEAEILIYSFFLKKCEGGVWHSMIDSMTAGAMIQGKKESN
jgi:hypothetical protein